MLLELDREYNGSEIGHFRAFAWVHPKGPSHGLLSFVFGATDNSHRLNITTAEALAQGKSGIGASMCGGQWEMRLAENQPETHSSGAADGEAGDYKYERAGSFTSVGPGSGKGHLHSLQQQQRSLHTINAGTRLLDIDECMFGFHLNRRLAERVRNIRIYANEYKLMEINASGISIEQSADKPHVPLLFSEEELADPWVTVRPHNESTFHVRFSEQTPRRFFHADEVADSLG